MLDIQFTAAQKGNCYEIAELIDIASGGLLDFLYHGLIPGKTPVQMVSDFLKEETGYYSCANTIVAKVDNDVVGISLSYPSRFHGINNAMKNILPKDRLDHLHDFFYSVVPDSLYIDSLAVHEKYRRQGICSRLISLAADRARREGLLALSLIVLADNDSAQELYKKHEFRSVKDIRLDHHELIPHHGGAYLMKSDL
jgi:ribosomal protein S18 acetylase RimI-like enzyme